MQKSRNKTQRPPKKINEDYLHNAGLYYLQRFAASTTHFKKIMMRKINRSCRFHTEQDKEACVKLLDAVIEKFQRAGLLDDVIYARGMVESLRRRGLSSKMIYTKLMTKGLPKEHIAAALERHDNERQDGEDSELHAAMIYARRKKIGPYKKNPIPDEKALATMARAGFSYDIAQKIIRMESEADI